MFWSWRNSRITNSAVAFFNSINNNSSSNSGNNNNQPGASKKAGYNKLSGGDETSDLKNANNNMNLTQSSPTVPLTLHQAGPDMDESSSDDFDLDDEDEFSDSEYDEALTCNVCDRSFSSPRQLSQHQQKKRHFGCSACDSLFHTLMALEHHKEEFEHWSGDEHMLPPGHHHSDDSSEETSEEMERLL